MRRVSTAAPAGTIHANFRTGRSVALAFALTALALAGALLALAPGANAAKAAFATLGEAAGSTGGLFSGPRGIAVNQSGNGAPAGSFYVVEAGNSRVQQFSPSGEFVRAWGWAVRSGEEGFEVCTVASKCRAGTGGDSAGQLNNAQGIAIDQATGNVYVANSGSRRIAIYKATGVFMGAFGWGARDGSSELQFCTTGTGCESPGDPAPGSGDVGGGQFGSSIGGLATDSDGNLYVANRTSRRVDVFKPQLSGSAVTGIEWLRSFGWGAATGAPEFQVCTTSPCKAPAAPGPGLGQFGVNSPSDVGVDSEGNVYALDAGNKRVQKFSPAPAPLTSTLGSAALSATFGSGNLIALAVEPETNHVLVLGNRSTEGNRVAIVEFTAEGAGVETHATGSTVNTAAGLAITQPSLGGVLYFSSSAEFKQRVFALNHPQLAPVVAPVTEISATGATFNGQVPSDEVESAYRFEYSTDGFEWTKAPEFDATVPAQSGSASVQQEVNGLKANTQYKVRISANRPATGWTLTSPALTFTTAESAPTIEGAIATQITNEGARLVGYLNPNHDETVYRFEYGTTAAYGASVPVPNGSAGSGADPVTVSHLVSNLSSNTTYHFRLVAANSSGESFGSDTTFTTGLVAPSPLKRAFELVTPAESAGMEVLVQGGGQNIEPTASPDGESVLFTTWGPLPDSKAGGFAGNHVAFRSANGWGYESLSPPQNPDALGASVVNLASEDLSEVAIKGPLSPQAAPGGGEGTSNLFHFNRLTQTYRTMSLGSPPNSPTALSIEGVAATPDLDVSVFRYRGNVPLVEGGLTNDFDLYEWREATGTLDLVTRRPGTNEPSTETSALSSLRPNDNAISDDGSKIFFSSPTHSQRRAYVRIDGETTVEISKSQASVPDPNGPFGAQFLYASTDGSIAFFMSEEKLTDDATTGPSGEGSDLYRYDLESEELTDITVDGSSENGAQVRGVVAGAEDGSVLYFVANGVLAPGAEAGAVNLYRWADDGSPKGSISFVAKDIPTANYELDRQLNVESPGRATADGSRLLFTSTASLTGYPTSGYAQAYLYDAKTGEIDCVSCNPLGGPATSDVEATGTGEVPRPARTLSADGRRVFFTSLEALVPEDEDSLKDVYEYDDASGQISLISSGTDKYLAQFQDASLDGRDVFFSTREPLVGIDQNETIDVYDARVGGGFASQNPPLAPIPCGAGECRLSAPPPPASLPGSATVQGPGNASSPRKHHKKKHHKKKKKHRKKKNQRNHAGNRHGQR